MHIHSFSKILGLPIVLFALGIFYYSWTTNNPLSALIIVPAVLVVTIYVFHGPIDHWWLSKFPPPFDSKLREWLTSYFLPYSRLDAELKSKFEYRMSLYLDGRLFKSVGSELRDVPEDIKCMVAAHGVLMCLELDDYLIGDMDRIYLYKHPFPTPLNPQLHQVEVNIEDGVIILSLDQLTKAVLQPKAYYNTGFHAYGEAFSGIHPQKDYPDCSDSWDKIKAISGWDEFSIKNQTGLESLNPLHIHITLFFSHNEAYRQELPENYVKFSVIFNKQQSLIV